MRKLLFLSLFMASTFSTFAQDAVAAMTAGETNARAFFAALQSNDTKTLNSFVASKETYLEIVSVYEYQQDLKRQKAKAAVETGYEKQAATITKSFQDVQAKVKAAGADLKDCKISLVQVRERERGGLKGGRALIQITDAAQHEIVIMVRGFYEFKGKWYVMDAVRLRGE